MKSFVYSPLSFVNGGLSKYKQISLYEKLKISFSNLYCFILFNHLSWLHSISLPCFPIYPHLSQYLGFYEEVVLVFLIEDDKHIGGLNKLVENLQQKVETYRWVYV